MKETINQRQRIEVADVLKISKQTLETQYNLCAIQQKALEALIRCRTSGAGGHVSYCNNCGHKEQSYNSCRDRHCPKCQFIKQEQWVDKLKSRLMPGRYFHIVFTVPHQLNTMFYINQRECYRILFSSAWEALKKAGNNSGFLGAEVGAVAVLHTWGQTLSYHPHVHMLVPAGGLSEDGMEWIEAPRTFFVPVKALSAMFRGIIVRQLKELINEGNLKLPIDFEGFEPMKKELYSKNWNVYCKKALGGINSVLQYLGRYTHRVAISNSRLMGLENGKISFRYRSYRQGQRRYQMKTMALDTLEFARRFLQHILPSGFYKIRYFGILATANIATKREQAIALIGKTMWLSQLEGLNVYEVLRTLTGKDPALCPVCHEGIMHRRKGLVQRE
jgi:hypothetical protein